MKEIILKPIKETDADFHEAEIEIRDVLKDTLYLPLLRILGTKISKIENSNNTNEAVRAVESGRIIYHRGIFLGSFNSKISLALMNMGAEWDTKEDGFRLAMKDMPMVMKEVVRASSVKLQQTILKIDTELSKILPEEIAGKVNLEKAFDRALLKTDMRVKDTVKGITIIPDSSPETLRRISEEYTNNLKLYIKDWSATEIVKLRKLVQYHVEQGCRVDDLASLIIKRYGVGKNKAKFWATQETNLLMTNFKQSRYIDAGAEEYLWGCVAGSKNHPVRKMHKALEGKRFRWDNPPITSEDGRRNNPGQDFNCRCFAIPIVRFS